jgi:hypothetical protein
LEDRYSEYCIKCNKVYNDVGKEWCEPCQKNNLRKNFTNCTSRNEKIDNFIQEKQLGNNDPSNILFEWILYDQFFDIEKVNKNESSTIYSAKWKNGPLYYHTRSSPNKIVALKYLRNKQNIDEFLNEV